MKYTSFNKANINKQIKELNEKYKETKLKKYLYDIEILESLKEDPNEEIFPVPNYFKDLLMEDSLALRKNKDFIHDINTFASLSKVMETVDHKYIDTWNISISSLFSFVHDFYNSLDKDIAKKFNKVFKERKNNFKLSNMRSYTISLPTLNYSYINIEQGDTIYVYLTMVHEYAHAIADLYHPRKTITMDKYPYIEYFPLFIELLALDELCDTYDGFEDDTAIIRKEKLNLLLSYAKELAIENYYMNNINSFKNKKNTINELKDLTHLPRKYFKEMFSTIAREKLLYVIPYMVSIESYYQFIDDPEFALNNAKILINLEKANEYKSILEDLNIVLNHHSQQYATEVTNKVLQIKQG